MLCAPFNSVDKEGISHANKKADLIELHLEKFSEQDLREVRALCLKPVIFKLPAPDYNVLELAPDYVDLPHTVSREVFVEIGTHFPKIKRICSYHDYEKTGDLDKTYRDLLSRPAEIYKIATFAQKTEDALRMLQLVKKHKCLGMCMGEEGAITRILGRVFGAPWTYAPLTLDHQTAPGQILLEELEELYHLHRHHPHTRIYALIGDPVNKSTSPQKHNSAFAKHKLDGVYVKMRVGKEELAHCFPLIRDLGFKGLSVTMPLKEAITEYLDVFSSKTVNTVGFRDQGIYGWNTDGPGALNALEKTGQVKAKKIVMLGAGGAAWGIAVEAKKRGATLIILNRNVERARALAREVGGEAFALSDFHKVAQADYDILINCTSVGMDGDPSLPVEEEHLLEQKIVMDIVSRPNITPLILAAQRKKCEIVYGMDMFTQQAIGQYCHWFNRMIDG